tara:strand:- start:41 stop:418 length:378 start_codon:yes stop_codon:yes gene_type:complete
MIKKIILLSIILGGCATPPDPPAYACSPRLDGGPTYCPPPDGGPIFPKPKPLPKPTPVKGEIDIWSNAGLWQLHYMYQRAERRRQMEANMTHPVDSINKALLEFNYGSDGSTKSEELLQLPSDKN